MIQGFARGLASVRSTGPGMQLSLGIDPHSKDDVVLQVKYPAPNGNPAARDVWCDAETRDWASARAISFRVKPEHALRLSVSFQDRLGVAYTSWVDLRAGEWQTVRVAFSDIRPNPYFQPPNARLGMPIDVSDVARIGFAPQDQAAGSLEIGRLVLTD
ncbi:MAG: carbohydrate binding domain-containing protein [Gemmatimonadaceae bacterium]